MAWTMADVGELQGKTILVTGSNTGIGYATAKLLASRGAKILMACRNPEKAGQAQERLRGEVPNAKTQLVQLDLGSLDSVRKAAESVTNTCDRLDGLINNAGLMMPPLGRTSDGFEVQFGTNVLGHFAFTGRLLPLLQRAPHSRVVWLSSVAHWDGEIDFDNLNAERGYKQWRAYAQSKLADLLVAYEMQSRLERSGIHNVLSLGAHPGGTNTELGRYNGMLKVLNALISPFTQAPEGGAMPSIRAVVDPAVRGGEYFGPGAFHTMTGPPTKQRSAKRSHDHEVAARLWQVCEQLTNVRFLSH